MLIAHTVDKKVLDCEDRSGCLVLVVVDSDKDSVILNSHGKKSITAHKETKLRLVGAGHSLQHP